MTQTTKLPPQHRLQIDDVYRDYADGLLTVKGALFYAVAVSRKLGFSVNFNVSEFLEKTGIHKGSYARALSQLIQERRLDFPPNSVQTLRVPVLKDTLKPAYFSLDSARSQNCDVRSQFCDARSQICDRAEQICDRAEQICDRGGSKTATEGSFETPSISLSSLSISLSSGERDPEFLDPEYEQWLTKKALQLPTPPTLLQEWIEKNQAKKSNRKEFTKYKESLEKAVIPQPAEPLFFDAQSESAQRLATLQHWWGESQQARVKDAIAAHPEWNLCIGPDGPEVQS